MLPSPGGNTEKARIDDTLPASILWTSALNSSLVEWLCLGPCRTIQLALAARRIRPDLFYTRVRTSAPLFCLAVRLASPGTRVVSGHPGWVPFQLKACGQSRIFQGIAKHAHLMNARFSHRCRVVASGIGDALVRHRIPRKRVFVVGNGTDTAMFRPIDRSIACRKVNMDPALRYIGFGGVLEKWQGVEHLLHAAPSVLAAHDDVRLLIVGDGPRAAGLQSLADELAISDRCIFKGQVPHADMPYYINCFELALLFKCGLDEIADSLYSSLKLRDYAACGMPTLASSGATDHAVIEREGIGVLVDPADREAVAAALNEMLGNRAKRQAMSLAARAIAENEMDWQHVAHAVLQGCMAGQV